MKNLGVDIIYILNRPQDIQRKERVLQELKNAECNNYEIIKSVTGDRINSIPELIKKKELFPVFTDPVGLLTKNIIATCYTHYKAVEKFYNSDYNTCLILEDDAIFTNEFWKDLNNGKIKSFIKEINQTDYDLIFWGRSRYVDNEGIKFIEQVSDNLYRTELNTDYYGAHAYQLNKKGAKHIIENTFPIKYPADVFLEVLDIDIFSPRYSYITQNQGPVTEAVSNAIMSTLRAIGNDGDTLQSSTKEDFDYNYCGYVNGSYKRNVMECRIFDDIPIEKVTFTPRKLPNGKIVENWATIYFKKE